MRDLGGGARATSDTQTGVNGRGRRRLRLPARLERPVGRWITGIVAGCVAGFLSVVSAVSYAALIASGGLEDFLPEILGIALVSGVVTGALVAAFSSFAGSIAVPQDRIAPILALLAPIVVEAMGPGVTPQEKLLTVAAAILTSTLVTGLFLLGLGAFRLGGLIRFVPYSVVGGFLAGTGWLLVEGSLRVMRVSPGSVLTAGADWAPHQVLMWLPGVVMAVTLVVILRRRRHILALPAALLLTAVASFALLAVLGLSLEDAMRMGWLVGPFEGDAGWTYLAWDAVAGAHWGAIIGQPASFATIAVVTAISLLLNATALEVVTGRDVHLNQELRVTGLANVAASACGGMVGFASITNTSLAYRFGATGRTVGLLAAAASLLALVYGVEALALVPRSVLGCLLLFLGLSFLVDWVVDGYRRLSLGDYFVVLLILFTIAVFGFLESVVIGLLGAVCLFTINYSKVDVVKQATNAVERQSNVDRPPRHQRLLMELGRNVYILRLQGFLFFGTANRLFTDLRSRFRQEDDETAHVEQTAARQFVILDFHRVSAMDSSAVLSFTKIAQLADRCDFTLVMSSVSAELRRQLDATLEEHPRLQRVEYFTDLDHAVEWCENELLANETHMLARGGLGTLQQQIEDVAANVVDAHQLMKYIDRLELAPGEELIAQGDKATDMYFIESGTVTINLVLGDGEQLRIRKMGAGTVTGELGLYLGGHRNANVLAESPAVVYRLSRTALDIMEDREPWLAAAFHKYMARLLSERLVQTNRALRALLD